MAWRSKQQRPVLVVEDDPDVQHLIAAVLEADGLPVRAANDGAEALNMNVSPSLIVLDWMLPGLFGDDLVGGLHQRYGGVPIVLVSAAHDVSGKAERIRAASYLTKPFDVEELVRTVRSCLTSVGTA